MHGPITPKCAVDSQEDLLRQVLGVRRLTREPVTEVIYATRMPLYQLLPGRGVSSEATLHQLSVVVQLGICLVSASPLSLTSRNAKQGRKVPQDWVGFYQHSSTVRQGVVCQPDMPTGGTPPVFVRTLAIAFP